MVASQTVESPAILPGFKVWVLSAQGYFGSTPGWMDPGPPFSDRPPFWRQLLVRKGRPCYFVFMMRDEERYWMKVCLTIGFVVLVLLLLLISGMIGNMKHIVITILEATQ